MEVDTDEVSKNKIQNIIYYFCALFLQNSAPICSLELYLGNPWLVMRVELKMRLYGLPIFIRSSASTAGVQLRIMTI